MAQVESFGAWLRRRRKSLDLTQEGLAERLGYSLSMVRKLEADELRPSKAVALRLAETLELPPEQQAAFVRFARDEGELPDLPVQTAAVPPAPASAPAPIPHNLPAPPTPLIGREHEQGALLDLLARPDVRLVTLTGPGGTGKTRLAIEVAYAMTEDGGRKTDDEGRKTHSAPRLTEGVFFVNLAPLSDPGLVASTIAQTLDVREQAGRPLPDALKDYLREKRLLLLLDNFEQVVAAAPVVADLLAYAPRVKALVTSRLPLHLRGEKEFEVPPLAVPQDDGRHEPDYAARITQTAAVALFTQRAQDVKPGFQVTHDNAPAVADICHRLDGLPLALELAAARIKALTPQALLQRLERRLPTLTGGPSDLPARQQTLRNAIAWSYGLLDAAEQRLFRRLGVFVGGCSLPAVEAVCDAEGDLGMDGLDGLISLVDKSLLRQEEGADGETRYSMLETIHEFARETLAASGEADAVQRQHAAFCLRLVEEAEPKLIGPEQITWLNRLELEHDNLRAALAWSQGPAGSVATGLGLVAVLWRFWMMRGYLSEGRVWQRRVLGRAGELRAGETRRKALNGAAGLAWQQGDLAAAQSLLEEYLALCREAADHRGIANALANLGILATSRGDYKLACSLHEESLALRRQLGNRHDIALELVNLGEVVCHEGNYARARALYDESLAISQELGEKWSIAETLDSMGGLACVQQDYPAAQRLYKQSLAIAQELADKRLIARCLEKLAGIHALRHQPAAAARLFGSAAALREVLNAPVSPIEYSEYDQHVALARSQLEPGAFEAGWNAGRALPVEAAVEAALAAE